MPEDMSASAPPFAPLSPRAPSGLCANCHSRVRGRYCAHCGQAVMHFHRPVWVLLGEVFEGFFGFDGGLWRTVPPLLFRPGRITADYLRGVRQPYISPVRLFLLSSLVFFLIAALSAQWAKSAPVFITPTTQEAADSDLTREELDAAVENIRTGLKGTAFAGGEGVAKSVADNILAAQDRTAKKAPAKAGEADGDEPDDVDEPGHDIVCSVRRWLLPEQPRPACIVSAPEPDADKTGITGAQETRADVPPPFPLEVRRMIVGNLEKAVDSPDDYRAAISRWAPRLAFFLAPVFGLMLAGSFFWRRDIYLYDHMVVALHYQSFLFLFFALVILAGQVGGAVWAFLGFAVWSNVYLYRLFRRVYGCTGLAALARTVLMDVLYLVILTFGLMILMVLGLVFV